MKKLLLVLFFVLPYTSVAEVKKIHTIITKTLSTSNNSYGGCMIELREDVNFETGLECYSRWVSLGCNSDIISEEESKRMWRSARKAYALDAEIRVWINDEIKHGDFCTAQRIDVFNTFVRQSNYNKDGKSDFRDKAISWWLSSKNSNREFENEPTIKSFTASPTKISNNEKATLNWKVEGLPQSLVIDNGVGDVTRQSSVDVRPSRTTTYTLTATNSEGSASAMAVVEVVPRIVSFTASPNVIRGEGETSTLRWRISGTHTCIQINNGVGEVTGQSSVRVTSAGTYTLKAFVSSDERNPCSGSFASRQVTVNGVPSIAFFRARPSAIGRGGVSILSWRILGDADEVSIDQGIGDVGTATAIEVSPERTIVYTLTALNSYGRAVRTVTVEVSDIPVIESFTASRYLISRNDDHGVQLQWRVSGPDSFQLNLKEIDNDGNRTDSLSCRNLSSTRTSCFIYPSSTTSYILVASNSVGEVESDSVRIDVLNFNNPDPVSIVEGQSSQLSWEGSESAEILQLEKKEGRAGRFGSPVNVAGSTSYEVSPRVTTYYRLKARHSGSSQFVYSNSIVVQVGGIISFNADPPFVVKFDNPDVLESTKNVEGGTQLRWSLADISNPQISLLKTVNGQETDITSSCRSSGCRVIPDNMATTYTLRVRNSSGLDLREQTTVNIFKIGRFKVSVGSSESTHQSCMLTNAEQRALNESRSDVEMLECLIVDGSQNINFSWLGFEGYNSLQLKTCKLENAVDSSCTETIQSVTGDRITITPSGSLNIYTLLAEKQMGGHSKTIELRVKVTVRDEALVNILNADDRLIKQGSSDQTTLLSWNISGKDPVNFTLKKRPEGGSEENLFSRTSPRDSKQSSYAYGFGSNDKKTTEFTLTADNGLGSASEKKVKVYYLKMGSFTAEAGDNDSSAENCSGADQCLTVISGTEVTLNWTGVEGFGDESTSSCGRSGQPECITDTLEITYDRGGHKISIEDSRASGGSETLTGSTNNNRIERAPLVTTTYTLTAKKQVGSEMESLSKTVKIIVQDTPSISSLTAREGSSNSSDLNRILDDSETSTYLHYEHTGKDPYNLKIEEKPQGESSFSTGDGFTTCASNGGSACKDYRQVTPEKTTEYKLTLEKPVGTSKDTRTLKVYKLGVERFKATVSRSGDDGESSSSSCNGADECLTVIRNEGITFSWSGITGFEDERSGDLVQVSKNASDACSSSSYEDDSNPSVSGSVTFRASGTAGVCLYTLTVQKTLGSGDNEETEKVTKTIKVSVNNSLSIDYFESRNSTRRADNTNIQRIIQNSGSTTLLWKVFSALSSDTWKLKKQEEGASTAEFEAINPSCINNTDSPSSTECNYSVSNIRKTTTFTLEVTLSDGRKVTSFPLKVYVLKLASFKGTRTKNGEESATCTIGECISIEQGASENVQLGWNIEGFGGEGTDTLEIQPNVQTGHGLLSCTGDPCKMNVTGRSSINISPTVTTIYTLTARKVIGSENISHSKKVRVTLGTRPAITTSAFKLVKSGSTVTICKENCGNTDLEWAVQNVTKVTIIKEYVNDDGDKVFGCVGGSGTYPNCTDLSNSGNNLSDTHSQSVTRTTKYVLKAENAVGERSLPLKVKVFRVKELTRNPGCIPRGGSSQLEWKVAEGINGANSVTIVPEAARDPRVGNQSSTCVDDRHGIESVCTGTVSVSPDLGGENYRWAPYHLTAKRPTGVATDISGCGNYKCRIAVRVGTCPSSGSIEKPKVSSFFQDCPVCPKMVRWKSLNISKMFGPGHSLDQQMRWIGNSQSDLKPYLQKSKESLDGNNLEESLANKDVFETADSDRGNGDRISQEKITYSEYQACVDEGFCSLLSVGDSLSSVIDENIGEFNEQETSLSQDVLQGTSLQEQGSDQNSSAEFLSDGSPLASVEGGYSSQEDSENGEDGPVTFSLSSAMQYARWLSEKTEKSYGVLADPFWADGFENSSTEDFGNFTSLSLIYNQNGILLYAFHPRELQSSAVYGHLIKSLLESEQIETLQSSDLSENETAFDEPANNNHPPVETLSSDQDFSQGMSGFIFRSGFHVVRPL